MSRGTGEIVGPGRTWDALQHRTQEQFAFAGGASLLKTITMTNRKCIHVR